MPVNLPTNLLRSFVAIVDSGSMLHAAERVFVSQSALSLQIKRLEELLQKSLFHREGRRLTLTVHGGVMLDYARKVLALHDEAVMAVTAGHAGGPARIGMVQDFAEILLPDLIARFADSHPDAELYSRIAGTAELLDLVSRRELDIVLGFAAPNDERAVAMAATRWFGKAELAALDPVPLAVLEKPCPFRDIAIRALEIAGRPYRIAVETPDLTSLRAAVDAGLGLTCRTDLFLRGALPSRIGLPDLGEVSCIVHAAPDLEGATGELAEMTRRIASALPA